MFSDVCLSTAIPFPVEEIHLLPMLILHFQIKLFHLYYCSFGILPFRPTLIYIMLIFTLRRTELHIGAAGYKYLSTVSAQSFHPLS